MTSNMTACAASADSQGTPLLQNSAFLAGLVDAATDAIIVCDAQQRIVLFNPAAQRMFGLSQEQSLQYHVNDLLPQRFREGHSQRIRGFNAPDGIQRAMNGDQPVTGLRADGEEFPVQASLSGTLQDGQMFYIAILRDVTLRERNREALVRSNQELQQFAFVASHDLRSPLRSIQGFLTILQQRHGAALDPAASSLVARAIGAALQMDTMTTDLLNYARLGDLAGRIAPVNMGAAAAQACSLLQDAITESGAVIHIEALPVVYADPRQMVQLLHNLLGNAIKYCTGRAPEVSVSAVHAEGEWLFAVEDNGIGIEAQYLGRIFDLFERLHSQHEYAGTGIGLAICRRIVERHGGRLWAVSEPGRGSTFCFNIPDSSETQ
jgi:PAS domain S-box-containing protein